MTPIQHADSSASTHNNTISVSAESGWHRQGKLWSNLNEICELLRIPAISNFDEEEFLFQHV